MLEVENMKVCINDNVPLDSRNQNANIKANILSDDKMREIGFTDYAKDSWYFSRRVGNKGCDINCNISFNVSINKKTKAIKIDVLDELFLQSYDFQMYMGRIPVANRVYDDVQHWMKYLMDNGVIYGYTLCDYI